MYECCATPRFKCEGLCDLCWDIGKSDSLTFSCQSLSATVSVQG